MELTKISNNNVVQKNNFITKEPEESKKYSRIGNILKMGKGQRAYRPLKLCYAMLDSF